MKFEGQKNSPGITGMTRTIKLEGVDRPYYILDAERVMAIMPMTEIEEEEYDDYMLQGEPLCFVSMVDQVKVPVIGKPKKILRKLRKALAPKKQVIGPGIELRKG